MGGSVLHFVVDDDQNPVSSEDIELVFGILNNDEEIVRVQSDDLSAMAVDAGVFPSCEQARKSGLEGPAPQGVNRIGTKKHRFWVWNPRPSDEKVVMMPVFNRNAGWFE
jgi:hypothetical protein